MSANIYGTINTVLQKSVASLDHSQLLTDPDEAVEFVKQTQVDALTVAIGTSHGAYKFSQPLTSAKCWLLVV